MMIKVAEDCIEIKLEKDDGTYACAGFNIMEAKREFLRHIEENFDKEMARLLIAGSFRIYK